MTIPKGLSILLMLTGVAALVIAVRRGVRRNIFPLAPVLLFACFFAWSLFKSFDVFDGVQAINVWGRLFALTIAGMATIWLFRNLAAEEISFVRNGFMVSLIMALLAAVTVYAVYATTGFALLGWKVHDPLLSLGPGLIISGMLSGPIIVYLRDRKRHLLAILIPIALLMLYWPMSTNLAFLSLFVSIAALLLSFLSDRVRVVFVSGLLVLILGLTVFLSMSALKPLANDQQLENKPYFELLENNFLRSIQHRLQIWDYTGDMALRRPVSGWGFGTSRRLPGGPENTFLGVPKMPLHPHNAVLQFWVELGAVGVVILLCFLLYLVRRCARAGEHHQVALYSLLLSGFAVASLAFGAWQNWWVSALWLSAAIVPVVTGSSAARREQV